jgi:hypothetical protein
MLGAMFVFESEASEYSASPGLGYVALGSQYDTAEPVFTSKKTMFQSQFSVARKPSETFAHWIECNPEILVLPKKFVRTGPVPAGSDIHLYDHCRTSLAVGGQASAGSILGELWLTYDCLATLPRSDESAASSIMYGRWTCATGTVTQALPFGSSVVPLSGRNTFTATFSGGVLTLPSSMPSGDYYIQIEWVGGAASVNYVLPALVSITNGTSAGLTTNIGTGYSLVGGTGPSSMAGGYSVSLNGSVASVITFSTSTLVSPAASTAYTTITQIPLLPPLQSPIFDRMGLEVEARHQTRLAGPETTEDLPSFRVKGPSRSTRKYYFGERDGAYFVCSAHDPEDGKMISDEVGSLLMDVDAAGFDKRVARILGHDATVF